MEKRILSVIALCAIALCEMADAAVSSFEINEGWRFRNRSGEIWHPATVPGTIHTDLMANDIIEDPFFRLNERGVQWVDKENWLYEAHFNVTAEQLANSNHQIVFYGLDTYTDIWLNHESLAKTDNMHRTYIFNVKGKLKEGDNIIEILLRSPIREDIKKPDKYDYRFNTGPDQSWAGGVFDKLLSIYARKAGYHYGWDWGPRLVTSGIWRPVKLEFWSDERIDDVQYIQKMVNAKQAMLTTVVEVVADADVDNATIDITADGKKVATKTTSLRKGKNKISVDYVMKNPRLWWSNGLGEPYLYKFNTSLTVNGEKRDARSNRIGIRSLRLVHEKDKDGMCLYFELNGKPVFMKGVDMVPLDNFLPRITKEKYEKHVLDAKNVNMNMIRVWGGGVYEDDYFYDLCDEHGILVWQDFMFACSTCPVDDYFLANIRQEAIDNVKRLRNHCSIAVWCGNNECQDVYYGWGGMQRYYKEKGVEYLTTQQFKAMYFKTLPEVVEEYGGGISYRPSSPYAFEDTASDGKNGDSHYWGVWHGRQPISQYNEEKSRFFSEYGFQSFPEFESIKLYAPKEEDWKINSETMMCHQRAGSYANGLIRDYLKDEFRLPEDFPSFLHVGMLLQGDAIKTAIEAHRRDMPHCMGTLVWQHNDCWPVASWAGRDYYGRWKAQQYFSRYAYDDILVSPLIKDDNLSVTIVTDRRKPAKGKFTLTTMTLDGKIINEKTFKYTAQPLTSKVVFEGSVKELLAGNPVDEVIFVTKYEITDGRTYRNVGYPVKQKYMNYTKPIITKSIASAEGGFDVTLTTDVFARGIFMSLDGIDNFFADNYFDLLPGQSRTIHVTTNLSANDFSKQLKVASLGDIYETLPKPTIENKEDKRDNNETVKPLGGD